MTGCKMASIGARLSWRPGYVYLMSGLLVLLWSPQTTAQRASGCGRSPMDDAATQTGSDATADSYSYPGSARLNMTWSADYKDSSHSAFRKLFDDIYPMLFVLFSCELDETRVVFKKVKVSFEEGSVKVLWNLTVTQPVSDPNVLSAAVKFSLQKQYALVDPVTESRDATALSESDKTTFNTVMATIGAVSSLIVTGLMLWGILKTFLKKATSKLPGNKAALAGTAGGASGGKGSSGGSPLPGLFGGGDVIATPVATTKPEESAANKDPDDDQYEETTAGTQGYYMQQAYVMPGTQIVATPTYDPGSVQVLGYPQNTYDSASAVYTLYGT